MSDATPPQNSEDSQNPGGPAEASDRRGLGFLTLGAAALVVLLAAGSLLWPRSSQQDAAHALLVFDSSGDQGRIAAVYEPLCAYLAETSDTDLELSVVRTVSAFEAQLGTRPDFVFAPDGLALTAPVAQYLPLVVGRRSAPRNLRPRGVLVSRIAAGEEVAPWLTHAGRTVLGDSLSLVATGVLRNETGADQRRQCAAGPDPYDHGPVLHALRLGGFDFAVVRQWDAERFFNEGLLDDSVFAVRNLVGPAPDAVLLVSRHVPRHQRLRCGEGLSGLGRHSSDEEAPVARDLRAGLAGLHLAGFNVLVEPDFELVRRNFAGDWPSGAD